MAEQFNWINESKKFWSTRGPSTDPQFTYALAIGCLQRIANALESIEVSLNPEKRALAREADKDKERGNAAIHFGKQVRQQLKRFCESPRDRKAVYQASVGIYQYFIFNEDVPIPKTIDALAFDISLIDLGPKTLQRFEAVRARARVHQEKTT